MAILKRATAQLRKAGIALEVHSCLWGVALRDPTLQRQTGRVYRSTEEAVNAALAGERPAARSAASPQHHRVRTQ